VVWFREDENEFLSNIPYNQRLYQLNRKLATNLIKLVPLAEALILVIETNNNLEALSTVEIELSKLEINDEMRDILARAISQRNIGAIQTWLDFMDLQFNESYIASNNIEYNIVSRVEHWNKTYVKRKKTEDMRAYQREAQKRFRESNREAFNAYHRKYVEEHREDLNFKRRERLKEPKIRVPKQAKEIVDPFVEAFTKHMGEEIEDV